ncbi:MAG: hypothetical protein ACRC0S_09275 [Fusobacteriaceae bacterium]
MNLYDEIGKRAFELGIVKSSIPSEITKNLKYNFFEWQKEAIRNFLTYEEICEKEEKKIIFLHEFTEWKINMINY